MTGRACDARHVAASGKDFVQHLEMPSSPHSHGNAALLADGSKPCSQWNGKKYASADMPLFAESCRVGDMGLPSQRTVMFIY
jgi:hypothetical protein